MEWEESRGIREKQDFDWLFDTAGNCVFMDVDSAQSLPHILVPAGQILFFYFNIVAFLIFCTLREAK